MSSRFFQICAEALEIPIESLNIKSTAADFASWDSLSHWDMISAIEDEYEIEFSLEEVSAFKCLGDILENLKVKGISLE